MYKFLTIKKNSDLFRLLKIEEGGDRSIYTHRTYVMNGKISFHSNRGEMTPPFRSHQYGPSGEIMADSIDEGRQIFISDSFCAFQKHHFSNGLPTNARTDIVKNKDIIIDITDREIPANFQIELFSEKRRDLLDGDFNNAVIVEVPLKTCSIIVGFFFQPLNY